MTSSADPLRRTRVPGSSSSKLMIDGPAHQIRDGSRSMVVTRLGYQSIEHGRWDRPWRLRGKCRKQYCLINH